MLKPIFTFLFFFISVSVSAQYYSWSKAFGGTDADTCAALAIDNQTNLYAIGSFSGYGDFRNDTIADQLISNGKDDIFLQKRTKKGKYVWSKKIGGKGNDRPNAMIYFKGSLYVSGTYEDTLDFGIQKVVLNSKQKRGIFIAKLDTAGTCIWVKSIGDSSISRARSLAINKDGIYLSGEYSGKLEQSNYNNAMFIQKRDFDGNVNWTKTFGSKRNVLSNSIALDSLGNVYNVGSLLGLNVDFDPSPIKDSILSSSAVNLSDIFIQKLSSNGEFKWVKKMGGSLNDEATTLVIKGNEMFVSGNFTSTVDFDPSSVGLQNLTSKGGKDIFVGKYDLNGKFVWIKQIGGGQEESAKQLEIDKFKNVFLCGTFNTKSGSTVDFLGITLKTPGSTDVFMVKFNNQGKAVFAKTFSGTGTDYGSAIKADTMQNVYIAGSYVGSITLDATVPSNTAIGTSDIFIYKSLLTFDSDSVSKENSIKDLMLNFKIYPNPVINELTISFDAITSVSTLSIISTTGQLIQEKEIAVGQTEERINTSNLTPGVYFVKLSSMDSSYTYKINKL